jgi:DNA-binding PadR family transcriptional regulator
LIQGLSLCNYALYSLDVYVDFSIELIYTKSDAFGMTKGGVSKMIKRLQVKNAIVPFKKPDNNKNIYFELTEKGKKISKRHQEIHKKWKNRDSEILAKLKDKEIRLGKIKSGIRTNLYYLANSSKGIECKACGSKAPSASADQTKQHDNSDKPAQ